MLNQNLLLTGDDGYNLTNSLRFRSSASAYLNRTPASAGNRQTWTWSAWVKRGVLGATQFLFDATAGVGTRLYFTSGDVLQFDTGGTGVFTTTQVFRDPSAWYHIVFVADTTQATASNRIKLYINGVQVTAFSATSYPAQNTSTDWNNTVGHYFGRNGNASVSYLDGYMTEINAIDGQALTPSSFGETDVLTGVWKPKKYAGTYGTNGFYLPFTDNSSLSNLTADKSGNSNNWTANNISLTAGATYDSMTDVPTLTSATTANYCVINPLVYRNSVGQNGYSNGNLTLSGLGAAVAYFNMATVGVNASSGKFYWECQIGTASSGSYTGVTQDSNFQSGNWDAWYDSAGGVLYKGGTSFASVATATTNDVISIAYDSTANTCAFYKNNTLLGTVTGLASATMFPLQCSVISAVLNLNFGQRPFSYTPPTGFVALNTFNLPNSTIVAGNKQMNAVLYTGDNAASKAITGVGFQPDFVWIKARNIAYSNVLYDVVRGTGNTKNLSSDTTNAEPAFSTNANLSSFDSDGFTIGSTSSTNILNGNTSTYVAWNWKANGTAVTNTAGSISSQVSANTTSGFSIVTYTGTGSTASVGHGLGVTPKFIIVKCRANTNSWRVYIAGITGNADSLILNSTAALQTGNPNALWSTSNMTSSTFGVGVNTDTNQSSQAFVAYCWAEVAGYSKFGSYTGNGSADGTFVFTGFRPRFVLIKLSSASGTNWEIYDSARNTYNATDLLLLPSSSNAESTYGGIYPIDLLSNGFKVRGTGSGLNDSGQTLIYACFAENPFKNSLAR